MTTESVTFSALAAFLVGYLRVKKRRAIKLDTVQTVIVPNKAIFEQKRKALIAGGLGKLQVIADFDRTITRAKVNGQRGLSCHGIIESCSRLSSEYHRVTASLFDKYHPLETTSKLTREEKIPLMKEWYQQNHDMMVKEDLHQSHISEAVAHANVGLRGGCGDMLQFLQEQGVPCLIFSAGIGNVLVEVLRQHFGELSPTTHVISNWIEFDPETDKISGFKEPLIHMFNKDETHTKGTHFESEVRCRSNVILLGDGLGDVTMASGSHATTVLKVGFLNANVSELLPLYRDVYDVIVTCDGPMDVVNELLHDIAEGGIGGVATSSDCADA